MSLVPGVISDRFSHSLMQVNKRTIIVASCKKCGEKKTCSTWDGSLQRWERTHRCTNVQAEKKP